MSRLRSPRAWVFSLALVVGGGCVVWGGCSTVGPLPEVDLGDPGWTVWTGQALWQPRPEAPSLAGELIVAENAGGDVLVSFSKPPLPIFTAQTDAGRWRIDFVERGRSYSGRGRPPSRFIWFRLPGLLAGAEPPGAWQIERQGPGRLRLEHPRRGESLRLVLDR